MAPILASYIASYDDIDVSSAALSALTAAFTNLAHVVSPDAFSTSMFSSWVIHHLYSFRFIYLFITLLSWSLFYLCRTLPNSVPVLVQSLQRTSSTPVLSPPAKTKKVRIARNVTVQMSVEALSPLISRKLTFGQDDHFEVNPSSLNVE